MKLISKFLQTSDSLAPTFARLFLGVVMLPHGLQKTLGLFGGYGFSQTYAVMTEKGMAPVVAILVIWGESVGALGLIFGFLTRLGALGIAIIMTGAILIAHKDAGFFMNWSGQQSGEGFEYHLLAIGLALSLLVSGGGKFSIDRKLS